MVDFIITDPNIFKKEHHKYIKYINCGSYINERSLNPSTIRGRHNIRGEWERGERKNLEGAIEKF